MISSKFENRTIGLVWQKGKAVPGYDSARIRKDVCGRWMKYGDYGNTDSQYGWEVDHIRPISLGGGDELGNLQPLNWQTNRHKGNKFPNWSCDVDSAQWR